MKNNNKIKICRLFGAKQFRKVVFILEKLKYKTIKKFFPDIINWYNKKCDKVMKKKLKNCSNDTDKKNIIKYYQKEKLIFKKEILEEKNRNYHLDVNHPTKILDYIEKNKQIHINGLKINCLILILNTIFLTLSPTIFWIIALFEIISAILNLQCINLQNYHLYIYKDKNKLERIKELENRQNKKNLNKYQSATNAVNRAFDKTEYVPSINELISEIKTKEEAKELLEYAKKQLKKKNIKIKELKKEGD